MKETLRYIIATLIVAAFLGCFYMSSLYKSIAVIFIGTLLALAIIFMIWAIKLWIEEWF